MNLVLFLPNETSRPLPLSDQRASHLLKVLRRGEGGEFDAGIVNGPLGRGRIKRISSEAIELSFAWGPDPEPLPPLSLLVGLPRPQTARAILRDATTLGATRIDFVRTEKGEAGYAQSTLWSDGEWERHLRAGAAQAFDTRVPEVAHSASLAAALAAVAGRPALVALDNYEAASGLSRWSARETPGAVVIAVGSERGWSAGERDKLRSAGFELVHLGKRVLRTETACVAAIAIVKARLGWI